MYICRNQETSEWISFAASAKLLGVVTDTIQGTETAGADLEIHLHTKADTKTGTTC